MRSDCSCSSTSRRFEGQKRMCRGSCTADRLDQRFEMCHHTRTRLRVDQQWGQCCEQEHKLVWQFEPEYADAHMHVKLPSNGTPSMHLPPFKHPAWFGPFVASLQSPHIDVKHGCVCEASAGQAGAPYKGCCVTTCCRSCVPVSNRTSVKR